MTGSRIRRTPRDWAWATAVAAAAWAAAAGLTGAAGTVEPAGGRPPGSARGSTADVTAGSTPPAPAPAPVVGPRSQYRTLLRRIEVPTDRQSYGDFYDFGYWAGPSYAGHADLPAGYWVYLAPAWHIFKDVRDGAPMPNPALPPIGGPIVVPPPAPPSPPPAWSARQAAGRPDTPGGGDVSTNWAPATADGQREWLDLGYPEADAEAVGVMVYESCGPGAVDAVVATVAGGEQVQVWAGTDPVDPGKPTGVAVIAFKTPVKTARVRVHVNSPAVRGWNEIDAVGLLGKDGVVRWATGATASSTYGNADGEPEPATPRSSP